MRKTMLVAIMLLTLGTQSAFAYIDPGSGSALMSIIIGFFVASSVVIKTFWYKIVGLLGLSNKKKTSNPDSDTQVPDDVN
jgi:hypothetical protein